MLPVNPKAAGQTLLGETVQAKLADVGPVDMVEVFRRVDEAPAIAEDAVRCLSLIHILTLPTSRSV